ncbi:hypothetical protein HMPREF9440_00772 [Sutterella parvirubra YIT 11816]|uniref:Uncharacterized protein n=1 Tax=Sutterella parvirubra YIT 11816 TaxID=762967 RepID=H3KDG3_9BURK|nr:hypothetical protein HMPREF9440_00772 [Sutterella parvirubra YIT 11816]
MKGAPKRASLTLRRRFGFQAHEVDPARSPAHPLAGRVLQKPVLPFRHLRRPHADRRTPDETFGPQRRKNISRAPSDGRPVSEPPCARSALVADVPAPRATLTPYDQEENIRGSARADFGEETHD